MRISPLVAFVFAFGARAALAHDLGVSRTDLTERADGAIHAHCTFAARDLGLAIDHDGHLAIDLRTDGAPCTPGEPTSTPDGDGLVIDEDFACTRATRSIDVVEYFGTEDIATITTSEGTHQELLDATHRAISVSLDRPRGGNARRVSRVAPWMIGAGVALLALIAIAIRSILRRRS